MSSVCTNLNASFSVMILLILNVNDWDMLTLLLLDLTRDESLEYKVENVKLLDASTALVTTKRHHRNIQNQNR